METIYTVTPEAALTRLVHMVVFTFIYLYIVAKIVGPEHKQQWFKKRQKYTFFNRRGVFGEDINFGYPRTWQGLIVFVLVFGVIFGLGYWYIFVLPY